MRLRSRRYAQRVLPLLPLHPVRLLRHRLLLQHRQLPQHLQHQLRRRVQASSPSDAPMPGKIIEVKVSVGQAVKAGDTLLILEAMKMQNEIAAPADGTVKAINVSAGQSVKVRESMVILG